MSATGSALERYTVGRWFALVTGGLVLVAAIGLVVGLLALDRLTNVRGLLVDRLEPAQGAVQRLRTAFVDEETGVRGFALGGEQTFLEPYRRGLSEERRAFAVLAAAARDKRIAGFGADLASTRAAAERWRREYAEPAIRAVAAGRRPPSPLAGKRRFDAVRAAQRELQADLALRRNAERARLGRTENLVRGLFIAAGLLLVLSVLAAAVALRATVVRPLARLAAHVRRVAGGDFSRGVRAGGPREVADLGRDVDRMRARIVAEVTALQEAESALTRQAADLRRSNAELEQFAYVASHDLQEPLRKVASFTQMLQKRYEGQLDERAQTYIAFASDGAHRMQRLINDLLEFSRVGRGGRPLEPVDCHELVARARANLAVAIEESGAVVEVGFLPVVRGDATLLVAVFQNLIGNAVKFRRSDRAPWVRLEAGRQGREWVFSCTDNGIGVEPEYADRIFVIFQRLHGQGTYEGTGIGLAMCRKIVEHHGGRIWLGPPPPDGGTTLCLTLPAADEEESA